MHRHKMALALLILSPTLMASTSVSEKAVQSADSAPVSGSAMSPLAGTWTLKSAYDLHKDGTKTFGFGSQPKGILIVGKDGNYSLQVFRSNEPTFGVDEHGMRKEFKPGELASTHYGHVSLDAEARTVTFHIELSYVQRWNGTVQVRPYTLSGDELSYQVPSQPGSDSVAVSVWKRIGNQSMQMSRSSLEQEPMQHRTDDNTKMP
jgi:hypothetical protein